MTSSFDLPPMPPRLPSLTTCDKEPIHVPGSVQGHGIFLAVDSKTGAITNVSENAASFFHCSTKDLLGSPAQNWLVSSADAATLNAVLQLASPPPQTPLLLQWRQAVSDGHLTIVTQSHQGFLIDIEPQECSAPQPPHYQGGTGLSEMALQHIARLARAADLAELFAQTTQVIKDLTGYDRVMLYRFDQDFNGAIVAESKEDHLESFLGLHYPASDIPAQARALYQRNLVRQIPSISRVIASPLVPQGWNGDASQPVDLSLSSLRSVSPVHIEYLSRMGVEATLVCSLMGTQTLWGLISCHHYQTKFINYSLRKVCEIISQTVASRIANLEALKHSKGMQNALLEVRRIVKSMRTQSAAKNHLEVLQEETEALQQLTGAHGVCIWSPQRALTAGVTPPVAAISALVQWLGTWECSPLFVSDQVSQEFPPFQNHAAVASGVLAMRIVGSRTRTGISADQFIVLFAPEWEHTVTWGGDPALHQGALAADPEVRLSPRQSFEKWKATVKGRSRPWDTIATTAATLLCHEITEHLLRLAESRLHESERLLFQAQKTETIGVLTGGIAHDFNNLLMAIQGFAERALRDPTRTQEDLGRILRCTSQGAALIRQLLQLAQKEPHVEPNSCIHLKDLFAEAEHLIERLLKKDVHLVMSIASDTPPISGKYLGLLQILMNLATNARNAMPRGGQLSFRAQNDIHPGWVRIEVSDNGNGILPEHLDKIFEPFFSVPQGGNGLGLAMVKRLTTLQGGTIDVLSTPGRGTTFLLKLREAPRPLLLSAEPQLGFTKEHPLGQKAPPAQQRLPNLRILVADDEADLRELTTFFLSEEGAQVVASDNGIQAMNAALNSIPPFDALIFDVKMPQLGGIGAYQELLRQTGRKIPTVFVTGDTQDAHHLPQDPWVTWLKKPYDSQSLVNTLINLLNLNEENA